MMQISIQIHPKSIENHSKSIKMVARSTLKANLEAHWSETHLAEQKRNRNYRYFGATYEILGATLLPAGRQGGPKIEHFGTRKHQKSENYVPEGVLEKA